MIRKNEDAINPVVSCRCLAAGGVQQHRSMGSKVNPCVRPFNNLFSRWNREHSSRDEERERVREAAAAA